jgi:hypothetical protein
MSGHFFLHIGGAEALFTLRQNGKISAVEFMVGMSLCTFADKDGQCWPSRRRIGECVGVHRDKTVSAAISALVEAGFISVQKTLGRSNDYIIQNPGNLITRGGNCHQGRLVPPGAEGAPGVGAESAPGVGAEGAPHNESINKSKNESSDMIKNTSSASPPASTKPASKAKRKPSDTVPVAFVEWQDARRRAGKVAPVPGKGTLRDARKLEELIPDAGERQAVMAAFFRLPDKNSWLAGRGHALWQLVGFCIDEARQAVADADGKPASALDVSLLTYHADKVKSQHGEAMAKCFYDKGVELGSIPAAQAWLTTEMEKPHAV